ncbi:MAG: caspase family protein [Rhizobiaceae bacterium]|nr:caspase family protein [Rhizobiaceae bacterium]
MEESGDVISPSGAERGRAGHALSALLALIVVFFAVSPAPAADLRGVALIVGNGAYEALPELANPENDADAIEELLSDLGFDSVSRTDRDAGQLKRDLERFVEDAADADVAVLYYAGHGIEAGGENWLVPTDADLSALDDAAGRLVPLSDVLRRLREVVPVTILLLDACRDNPFPPGVSLKKTPDAEPVPVAAGGLAETRGAARVTVEAAPEDNLGMVIGFAAEPGRPALDGDGGHSPYAAALLRHLAAMAGEEFGTVMRMVAEEVYLKTGGRQRPWVNESLRRLLYFGKAPDPVSGPEGDILAERRGLLLTIADLPLGERRTVERVAANGGVPMDAVYAVLEALGASVPRDAAELEEVLREKTNDIKTFFAARQAMENPDPELARLSALTDRAVSEGAIEAARRLRAEADLRIAELDRALAATEENVKARRTELAAEHARTAEVEALGFHYAEAAEAFGKAAAQVDLWDPGLAFDYRLKQVDRLTDHGQFKGTRSALDEAIGIARGLVAAGSAPGDRLRRAQALNDLGFAQMVLGARETSSELLEEAIASFTASLELVSPENDLARWANTSRNLAFAHFRLGERGTDSTYFERAAAIYRDVLTDALRERYPESWGETQFQLGTVLMRIGEHDGKRAVLEDAAMAIRASLEYEDRDKNPFDWAVAHNNLGTILWEMGEFDEDTVKLREALVEYRLALDVLTRDNSPTTWATLMGNRGAIQVKIGGRENDSDLIRAGIEDFRQALQVQTLEANAIEWAMTTNNLGNALFQLAVQSFDTTLLHEAIDTLEYASGGNSHDVVPTHWATMQQNLAVAYVMLGFLESDATALEKAIEAFDRALTVRRFDKVPIDWAQTAIGRGIARATLGDFRRDKTLVLAGRAEVEKARDVLAKSDVRGMDVALRIAFERIDRMLAGFEAAEGADSPAGGK